MEVLLVELVQPEDAIAMFLAFIARIAISCNIFNFRELPFNFLFQHWAPFWGQNESYLFLITVFLWRKRILPLAGFTTTPIK